LLPSSPRRLSDIKAGPANLREVIQERQIDSIAIPPLGCGNGGLEWSDVALLYQEASDSALMRGGLMPVAGWCRCGDHADLIEEFLSDYGLRYDDEGWVLDMLERQEEVNDF
jgi:hypothetical protein